RLSIQDSFDITVTPVNDAPVADATSAIGDEDLSLSIDLSGSDIDGDTLSFSLGSDASNGSVTILGSVATYAPNANFNGLDSFTFVANDGQLSSSAATVSLTVNPVNDAPAFDDLSDASVAEDTDFILELSASDIDGDALTFLASVDANGSVSVDGSTLTVTPAQDYNGDITVNVIASDGQASGSGSFTLSVTPVNDAPVLSALDNQAIDEDTSLTLELSANDVDGDGLTFTAENGDSDITVDGTTLTITPPANYNGSDTVTVTVSDGDLSDSTTFTLIVNPINDAPVVVNPIEDIIADEDSGDINIDLATVFNDVENGLNLSFSFNENVNAI
ncbi:uncharacterized protein METZ01_LOCUS337419, partial [marine metagenome]